MPYQTPLASIVTSSIGRGAELKYGPGNNQYARASDVNPIIDYIDSRAGSNAAANTVTQATNLTTGVTLNTIAGVITTAASTLTAATTTNFTLTNSNITRDSIVVAQVVGFSGNLGTNGNPAVTATYVSAGQVIIQLSNLHATNATGANSIKIAFIVY
jgi:hypothetical protein